MLYGEAGDDTLDGGAQRDTLTGGAGNDVLRGGVDSDTVSYADITTGGVGVSVNINLNNPQATGAGGTDTITEVENLTGTAFADVLIGNQEANVLSGGAGADKLYGGRGDDVLIGGTGDDLLEGDEGADTAAYKDASAGVTIDLAIIGQQAAGAEGRDTLVSISNLLGSVHADTLRGDLYDNVLIGGEGNDTLEAVPARI